MSNPLALIQDKIEGCGYDSLIDMKCRVAICLANKLRSQLSDDQYRSIQLAKSRLLGKIDEQERVQYLDRLFNNNSGNGTREFALNRIVISALETNEGLSGYMAEFLVEWSEMAGLNAKEICDCFELELAKTV